MGVEHAINQPKFPEGLRPIDIDLVKQQCELQHATSKEQIEGFANAYVEAKALASDKEALESRTGEDVEEMILRFAKLIEKRNEKGFRRTPVAFANGTTGLRAELIERTIQGDLLWKIETARQTGVWPEAMPPDVFGKK